MSNSVSILGSERTFMNKVAPYLPVDFFTVENDSVKRIREGGFFTAPASTKYHGSYYGGLFEHSLAVMEQLVALTEHNQLEWQRPESPYIVGIFHDLCKIDNYRHPNLGIEANGFPIPDTDHWEYNPNALLKGHGEKSVMLLSTMTKLTEEEVACIRYHMGAFTDKEEWSDYTRAIHRFPNVLWTHHADMIATHVLDL